MIALLLARCDPTLLDWYVRHAGALWLAGGVFSQEEVARLRQQRAVTVFEHPLDPADGDALADALATIEDHHPGETINLEGGGLSWLDELQGKSVVSLEYEEETLDWVIAGDGFFLRVTCPWRLIHGGHIHLGHRDRFLGGMREPVDAERRLLAALGERSIVAVRPASVSGDLVLDFGADTRLELFQDTIAYEGWNLYFPDGRWVVASPGGGIALGKHAAPVRPSGS